MHANINEQLWRRARTIGIGSCLLIILLTIAAKAGWIAFSPLLFLALGFLLATALRQAAVMTKVLTLNLRVLRWTRRGVGAR